MPPSLGYLSFEALGIIGIIISFIIYVLFSWRKKEKKAGQNLEKNILKKLPAALVVIDDKGEIIWCNPRFKELINRRGFLAGKLYHYLPDLQFKKNSRFSELITKQVARKDRIYQAFILHLEDNLRLILLHDVTEQTVFVQKSETEKPAIGIIQIDNYYEVLESIDDEIKPLLLADLDKLIGDWATEQEAYIKKYTDDKYLVFITKEALQKSEEDKFTLLDKVRSMDVGKIPVTISMGFGIQEESLIDLGRLAQVSLELALGRGGDQVVVKSPEKIWFYGGRTQALEKKTKVKARVIAHSLKNMILESENVIIMGHEGADYDCLGAAFGLTAVIKKLGIIPFIIIEEKNQSLDKLTTILNKEIMAGIMLKPLDIRGINISNSLLIVVDTNKPNMVISPSLLTNISKIVIIDHHRRGEEYIENAALAYIEPYASSTCELVTELIQYFGDEFEIDKFTATALLAGINVDTKNFIFQTGVRTFEAASYLRQIGADPVLVQKLLKDDFDTVIKKAVIVEKSQLVRNNIAISFFPETTAEPQVLAAQGADALLNIDSIEAAFVLCPLKDGGVTISARSTGNINVQVFMEKLGGGGHLTVAAAQIKDKNLEEVKEILINMIEENF